MAPSFEEIYFIHNDVLLRINRLDVNNEDNKGILTVLSEFENSRNVTQGSLLDNINKGENYDENTNNDF